MGGGGGGGGEIPGSPTPSLSIKKKYCQMKCYTNSMLERVISKLTKNEDCLAEIIPNVQLLQPRNTAPEDLKREKKYLCILLNSVPLTVIQFN